MKVFLFLFSLTLLLQVTLGRKKQPNIVFVLADDLGYNDIGYHNPDIITPTIDMLSRTGVRFENYYVQPICSPTRSQLLTGRYQIRTGLQHMAIAPNQANCLPLDEVTLPQKLKEVGYSTHIVGKWHLGSYRKECLPHYRGFDSFFGLIGGGCDYYTKEFSAPCATTQQLFTGYDFYNNDEVVVDNSTYTTYLYRDQALKLIKDHDKKKPLFLYMALQSPHGPLQVPDKYLKMYPNIHNDGRKIYSAMVTSMDDVVKEIVGSLQAHGMWEDTLFIFSSDNGGQTVNGGNNWPLRGRQTSLYEGGVKAVGFARGPGVSGFGRITKELMHVSDWFPTLIHVAGASLSGTKPLDGIDAWHLLADPLSFSNRQELLHNIDPLFFRPLDDDPVMLPYPNRHGVNTTTGHAALRFGKWKLLTGDPGFDKRLPVPRSNDEPTEEPDLDPHPSVRLFDVESDPTESFDVASLYPNVVDKMLEKIAAYNQTAVPVSYPPCDPQSDPTLHNGLWVPWMS